MTHVIPEVGGRGGSLQIASVVFHPTITMSQELNCGRSSTVDYQLSFIQLSGISMEELKGLSANTTCRTVSLCLTGTSSSLAALELPAVISTWISGGGFFTGSSPLAALFAFRRGSSGGDLTRARSPSGGALTGGSRLGGGNL